MARLPWSTWTWWFGYITWIGYMSNTIWSIQFHLPQFWGLYCCFWYCWLLLNFVVICTFPLTGLCLPYSIQQCMISAHWEQTRNSAKSNQLNSIKTKMHNNHKKGNTFKMVSVVQVWVNFMNIVTSFNLSRLRHSEKAIIIMIVFIVCNGLNFWICEWMWFKLISSVFHLFACIVVGNGQCQSVY